PDLPPATACGCGPSFSTPAPGRLALLPRAYASGIPRHVSDAAPVRVGPYRTRVAGRVSMDQLVVLLPAGAEVSVGDVAVLFGDARDGHPTAQDWADAAGTISYEIVTRLSNRVPRVHVSPEDPQ